MLTVLSTTVVIWLGTLFVYTGLLKCVDFEESWRAVAKYRLLDPARSRVVGMALPFTELAAAALLFDDATRTAGAILVVLLGVAFTSATTYALRNRIDVSCGCIGRASGRVNRIAVARAILVTGCGALLAFSSTAALPGSVVGVLVLASSIPAGVTIVRRVRKARQRTAATIRALASAGMD